MPFSITISGEKVCGGENGGSGGGKLCKLTLVISLSISQAEQFGLTKYKYPARHICIISRRVIGKVLTHTFIRNNVSQKRFPRTPTAGTLLSVYPGSWKLARKLDLQQ